MPFSRTRRKKALVTGCLCSVMLLYILSDTRDEHNMKNYQYFNGYFTSVNVLQQDET